MRDRVGMHSRVLAAGLVLVAAALSVSLLHAQRPERPAIARGTNVLFGQVLDAGTDAPVAGAVVTLIGFIAPAGQADAVLPRSAEAPGASAPRLVMTNGDGYFFFRELPAGRYAVSAQAFGYVNQTYPLRLVELIDSDRPATVSLRIAKHAAIAGRVLDERGEPVAGAPVSTLRREHIGGALALRRVYVDTVTDDRGMYRLANLQPGTYVVGVLSATTTLPASLASEIDALASDRTAASELRSKLILNGVLRTDGEGLRKDDLVLRRSGPVSPAAPDGKMLAYVTTFFPGTSTASEATVIALQSGELRSGVDFPLRLSPTVSVSGVVTGPGGPMANLAVWLLPESAADASSFEPAGAANAVTDGAGAFTFLGVAPGPYVLRSTRFTPERPAAADVTLWETRPLTIGESDVTGLAITLKPGISVSGRMEFRSASGAELQCGERCRIVLRPLGASSWRTSSNWMRPDATFRSAGDPAGRYFVIFAGPQPWTLETVSRGGRPIADDVIELDDAEVSDLVLTVTDTPPRVSGTVVDARGAAVFGTDVIAFPADTSLWRKGIVNNRRVRFVHATSAGAFDFDGLAPGEYYVVAVRERFTDEWQDPAFLDRLIAGATKVSVGPGEHRAVELKTFTLRER